MKLQKQKKEENNMPGPMGGPNGAPTPKAKNFKETTKKLYNKL